MSRRLSGEVLATERTLPHNLEAERSVLGAIIVHNGHWDLAASIVRDTDYYRDAHRRIWGAMRALIDRRSAIDYVTVKDELARTGDLDEVGGPAYITALGSGTPRSTNVEFYAGIVREKALLREIIFAANHVLATAYTAEESPIEILRTADRSFLELQRRKSGSRMRPLKETTTAILSRLEHRYEHKGELIGITTGFPSLDELTLGWRKKDIIIVAARPSIGKTSFVMNAAVAAGQAGSKVGIFSYEMRREQLEDRLVATLTGIPFYRLEAGALGAADWPLISSATEMIHALPLYIDDRSGQYVSDIRTSCRRMQNEEGLDLVVIDYVQLIPSELARRGASRNEQLTEVSRSLKELADELDVPVIVLSQLNRADERRADPRPQLRDLRDSGSLEQDADEVDFLHRRNHKESGTTNFIREKARNGTTGTRNLTFDRDTVTFTDGGEDPPEEAPKRHRKARTPSTADLPIEDPA